MKRNVLASFTDMLLLPVTIVPRAVGAGVGAVGAIGTGVGAAIGTGVGAVGTGVVQGISMLNPQRWVGNGDGAGVSARNMTSAGSVPGDGYVSFGTDGALFEVGEDDGEGEDADTEEGRGVRKGREGSGVGMEDEAGWGEFAESRTSENGISGASGLDAAALSKRTSSTSDAASTKTATTSLAPSTFTLTSASTSVKNLSNSVRTPRASVEALDLLLSLDVSLQLIHATRDAIKRLETFAAYPGTTGTRVRETLDDAFCEMLGAQSTRHITWGFGM